MQTKMAGSLPTELLTSFVLFSFVFATVRFHYRFIMSSRISASPSPVMLRSKANIDCQGGDKLANAQYIDCFLAYNRRSLALLIIC